jgi:sterol desaturase/sphingolipid hydroxylase (fatty acid hydroxylase superfamily)
VQDFGAEYAHQLSEVATLLFLGYTSLLLSWPLFLLLEKLKPVQPGTPRSNYWFNWKVTFSNLLLAPAFAALVVVATAYLPSVLGLPRLQLSPLEVSLGLPLLDLFVQGAVIFLVACILGDFSYYWWHRCQHTVPWLWEMHKLHHSDENLNSTTIYRSHFLEPAGQSLFRGLSIGLVFDTSQAPQTLLAAVAGGLLLGLWDYFIHANVRINALRHLLPFFSTPQFHWIHHSRMPEHQDKNFAVFLPIYDILFGSYYRPAVDEYPPTGLSTGERIDTLWEAQAGPLITWARMARNALRGSPGSSSESVGSR